MPTIKTIRQLCTDEAILITKHAADRLMERNIQYNCIKSGIMNGTIIESYPDDYPNPSVLIMGYTSEGKPIHIVAGACTASIQIITAYTPALDKWDDGFTKRKVAK